MAKITPSTGSTKPEGKDSGKKSKKEKKAREQRASFIAATKVNVEDPKQYPFLGKWEGQGDARKLVRATPEGYDYAKHERLSKKDFAKPSLYMTYRAEALETTARSYRQRAEEMRAGGDKKGSGGKSNRLKKTIAKVEELRAELAAQGLDVDALIAEAKADAVKKMAEAKAAGEKKEDPAKK